ncbi:hypothetical protein [Cohnella nanjingensis]|nr:hypothetical protein [Cohnella nanjingensis]
MRWTWAGIALLIWMGVLPGAAGASSYELSATAKTSFAKMKAAADAPLAAKLGAQYDELGALQKQAEQWDAQIKALHDRNDAAAADVRKLVSRIDADKIAKLDAQVKQAKERYKPLFANYAALNDKISAVRPLKNKELNALLKLQASTMKVSVQLARDEIRVKEAALKAAKASASAGAKKVRTALAETDPLKTRIQSEKSAASAAKKSFAAVWKTFNAAVKKQDAKGASDSLATLLTLARQTNDAKAKQHGLEQKIAETIAKSKSLLA